MDSKNQNNNSFKNIKFGLIFATTFVVLPYIPFFGMIFSALIQLVYELLLLPIVKLAFSFLGPDIFSQTIWFAPLFNFTIMFIWGLIINSIIKSKAWSAMINSSSK